MTDTTTFNVEWRRGGGHYVFLNDYTWHFAIFVNENEAKDYARYRQKMLEELGTTEVPRPNNG